MATSEIIKTHISNEMVDALRAQVGKSWSRPYAPWEVDGSRITRSQIRRWAVRIGDLRPVFLDLDYAKTTPWGTILAPPGMLQDHDQFDPGVQGLPGCQPILAACRLDWELPIRLGDLLVPTTTLRAMREVTQPPGHGRVVAQELETEITNEAGRRVGSVRSVWNCYERGSQAQRARSMKLIAEISSVSTSRAANLVRSSRAKWSLVRISPATVLARVTNRRSARSGPRRLARTSTPSISISATVEACFVRTLRACSFDSSRSQRSGPAAPVT